MRIRQENGPQNAETPQHACFPNLAHESKGDRFLISDARSQGSGQPLVHCICTCQHLEEAIKHSSRAWNAKCLQLGKDCLAARAAHGMATGQGQAPRHGTARPPTRATRQRGRRDRLHMEPALRAAEAGCWPRQTGIFWMKPKWAG